MKRYEARIEHDIEQLRERVGRVCEAVYAAVERAVAALSQGDTDALYSVSLHDMPINREVRSIDARCHAFVARHLPAAGYLRFVSSVLRLNIALERIGDYAVTIGRIGVRLTYPLDSELLAGITQLSQLSLNMLHSSSRAFLRGDMELAQETCQDAARVDAVHDALFQQIVHHPSRPLSPELFSILTILHQLERVSDQAKNICEEAIFSVTGQTKAPKIYRVMFVDQDNAFFSQLAEAMARKAFPGSGRYFSAGLTPAPALHPALAVLAEQLALDLSLAHPRQLSVLRKSPAEYHVLVSIGPVSALPELPFRTVLQRWPIPSADTPAEQARELAQSVRELMETLRGSDAP